MSMSEPLTFAGFVVITVALLAPDLGSPDTPSPSALAVPATAANFVQAPRPAPIGNGLASRELERSPDGHFYVDAQVNGARIRFLVDTGATFVAMTAADARRAGIVAQSERVKAIGAGGELDVTPVTIDRIAIGPLVASNIGGAVIDELPVSLLGQSFLSQVSSVRIEGDRMILR